MIKKYKELIVVLIFALLSIFIFKDYFFKDKVPFPSNLLVSFYQPWASYSWEGYPSGPPNKPIGFDNLRIFYPLRKLTIEQFKNLEWPLWNPYDFSGNTHLATYQAAVFHPLSFLFIFLPQIEAWSLIIILAPFLSSVFMYFFLKEINLNRKASFFGALTFAFSGFMVVWWQESFMSSYSALFLPLILLSIERFFKKVSVVSFIGLVFGLSFSVLSGWFQMTLYVFAFSFLWLFYFHLKDFKKKKGIFLPTLFAFPLSLFISSVHLLPSFEAYFFSARGTTDVKFIFDQYLLPLQKLIIFLVPDFFGNPGHYNYFGEGFYYEKILFVGIPALFFGLYELFSFKKITNKENFFKWLFLITLSLGLGLPSSWFLLYNLKLPFVSVILPTRIFFLSTFCISVLAAFGIEKYLKTVNKKKIILIFFLLGLTLAYAWIFVIYYKINKPQDNFSLVSFRNLIPPTMFYFLSFFILILGDIKSSLKNKVYVGIVFISFLSLFYFANKYLYFSERKFIYPEVPVIKQLKSVSGINRIWGTGEGYIDRNFLTYFGLFSPEGYDSIYIRRYGELLHSVQNRRKLSENIPRADATISRKKNFQEILIDPYQKKLIQLLGVRFIVESNNKKNENKIYEKPILSLKSIWQDSKFTIYEYKDAFPRVFIGSDYVVIKNPQEIINKIFDTKTDLAETVILEEDIKIPLSKKGFLNYKTKILSYKPNKISIEANLSDSGILLITDNYYPGWKAYVDGEEASIYRANYTFRAVPLTKGRHIVVFQYKPKSFYNGLIMTFFGLFITLLISIKIRYNRLKQ